MISKITSITPLPNYQLRLEFEDGLKGKLDLSHLKGQHVFKIWDDYSNFETVHISESGAIEWVGGIDICPNNAYLQVANITYEEYARNK